MINLNTPISELLGIGKVINKRLSKLDINTITDLLKYLPWRYENLGQTQPIDSIKIGQLANIVATIELIQNKRSFRRKLSITEALVSDDSGSLKVVWFNQPFLIRNLKPGDQVSLAGKLEEKSGQLVLSSPIYEKATSSNEQIHTKGLVPIYHLTSSLAQKQLRSLIKQVLPLAKNLEDWLPKEVKKNLSLLDIGDAITKIHFPKNKQDIEQARKRFAFEEMFIRQLKSQDLKQQLKSAQAPVISFLEIKTKEFVNSLPFTLTNQQKQSAWDILQDIDSDQPMTRLLEGDVGSGKTVVAVLALLNTALNNKLALLMAPTEILAQQHFQTITKLLKKWGIKISLYTRSYKEANYNLPDKPKTGDYTKANIIIGTHALIQKKSPIDSPDLVIVDEQHRFGVGQRQRLALRQDNLIPHFLSMTATPIPRSLALAIYGHLDLSIIKELPANRQPITTKITDYQEQPKIYEFVRQKIKEGRQVFVICPLIDPSDKLGVKSVKEEHQKLDKEIFPNLKIVGLHGKMKGPEKEQIMTDFLNKKTDILVSTSVVEVGVDIPNAAIIVIEDAQRFGLAQLHQFRGRVGRSKHKSYCFLMLDENANQKSKDRLQAMVKFSSGFDLAQEDLKLRGSGEIYGTIQSGFNEINIASLLDQKLIEQAQEEAKRIIKKDSEFIQNPLLKQVLFRPD